MLSHRLDSGRKPRVGEPLRVLRDDGSVDPAADPKFARGDAERLYRGMMLERILDDRMLSLQRQGRIGFYGPSTGQEAAIVGAAMAMESGDWIVPQYREPGAALARGMPLKDLICQFMTNSGDPAKGRQMPCHYVYRKGHFLSISSPVGTQIPHAMGIAWGMKLRKTRDAVLVYFGDGATSTPDFHVSMNFAGVFGVPCVFFCNNNQWAISLPVSRQTASATLAEKGQAYGLPGTRVDGMDVLAVFGAVQTAARAAREGRGPALIEALTYRFGPHSSSDDPSRYRDEEEAAAWRARDPIVRFRGYLESQGWWDEEREATLERSIGDEITQAVAEAEAMPPVPVDMFFTDVTDEVPWNLGEQLAEAKAARRG
jgi:pyruvate dehydrogenase E1 component alpha subunit